MATTASCGYPLWLDGMTWNGLLSRQYGSGTAVYDAGTASALTPGGGVFAPGSGGGLAVTAPVSGMTVNIAAGYCCVPSVTPQAGAYIFGLMSSGSLTVASNATGSTRKDLVVAFVSDTANSSSFSEIEYITGTTSVPSIPASSIVLAEVDVPNGAANIVSGDITDKRVLTVGPGCILPIATATAAPAAPASQVFWNLATSALANGTGTAGTTGSIGATGMTEFVFHDSGFPSVSVTADGITDYEIYYEREPATGLGFGDEQVYIQVRIDSAVVDTCYVLDTATILGRVSCTYYTSSGQGTTPSAGVHTISMSGSASEAQHTLRVTPVST